MKKLMLVLFLLLAPLYAEKVSFEKEYNYTYYCVDRIGEYECLKVIKGQLVYQKIDNNANEYRLLDQVPPVKVAFLMTVIVIFFLGGIGIGAKIARADLG